MDGPGMDWTRSGRAGRDRRGAELRGLESDETGEARHGRDGCGSEMHGRDGSGKTRHGLIS